MNDISNKADVKIFVDAFYQEVQKDMIIGPVFAAIIPDGNWDPHLARMYSFWYTVLFGQRDYVGNPFSKHRNLPIEKRHFDRWTTLFATTIDQHFEGQKANEAKERAVKMGLLFQSKLEYLRKEDDFKNIV